MNEQAAMNKFFRSKLTEAIAKLDCIVADMPEAEFIAQLVLLRDQEHSVIARHLLLSHEHALGQIADARGFARKEWPVVG
jgi:hypothetical protein